MSCYEWEEGTIRIPTAEWAGLKKAVREAFNARQESAYQEALSLYESLVQETTGKRGYKWGVRFGELLESAPANGALEYDQAHRALWPKTRNWSPASAPRPNKPLKRQFPHANAATRRFPLPDAAIEFDEARHAVTWTVPENNHACDRARAHPIARTFFGALGKIAWTRGSGGTIAGNNEYATEDREVGGGANFVKDAFGPGGAAQLHLMSGLTADGRLPRRRRTRVAA